MAGYIITYTDSDLEGTPGHMVFGPVCILVEEDGTPTVWDCVGKAHARAKEMRHAWPECSYTVRALNSLPRR